MRLGQEPCGGTEPDLSLKLCPWAPQGLGTGWGLASAANSVAGICRYGLKKSWVKSRARVMRKLPLTWVASRICTSLLPLPGRTKSLFESAYLARPSRAACFLLQPSKVGVGRWELRGIPRR